MLERDARTGHYVLFLLSDAIAPITIQTPSASHSLTVKWPGTKGTIFIIAIAVATIKPNRATACSGADRRMRSERDRARARQAAQVAAHPIAQATEPTSVMGTSIASPSSMQAPVAMPIHNTATD